MTRRDLLRSLSAVALTPRMFAFAQAAKPVIPVRGLTQFTLLVSDMKRSIDFYQNLFGMPIQTRQGSTVLMRIGSGPQFMALAPAGSNPPSIAPIVGMSVDNFNPDKLAGILEQHGITKAADADPGLSGGAMKMKIRTRDGVRELFLGDPDNCVIQLHDTKYCGGSGAQGETCGKVEASPKPGLLAVKEVNHFTINSSNGNRSNQFYRELFGLPVRSQQGAALGLGVGPGKAFVMFAGGGGGRGGATAPPRPASINHVCMNMENFKPDDVLKTLSTVGITPREGQGAAGPLKSYVTLRMENRGGAPGGTPELYFTDPDGLLIQLQDVTYCGGGGYLGNVCAG
jgi:catechol 2,3-dioxygenase-like lactoylglutathione lyase family enzyme